MELIHATVKRATQQAFNKEQSDKKLKAQRIDVIKAINSVGSNCFEIRYKNFIHEEVKDELVKMGYKVTTMIKDSYCISW